MGYAMSRYCPSLGSCVSPAQGDRVPTGERRAALRAATLLRCEIRRTGCRFPGRFVMPCGGPPVRRPGRHIGGPGPRREMPAKSSADFAWPRLSRRHRARLRSPRSRPPRETAPLPGTRGRAHGCRLTVPVGVDTHRPSVQADRWLCRDCRDTCRGRTERRRNARCSLDTEQCSRCAE